MDIANVVNLLKTNGYEFIQHIYANLMSQSEGYPNEQTGWFGNKLTWFYIKRLLNNDLGNLFTDYHYDRGLPTNCTSCKIWELIESLKTKNLIDMLKYKIKLIRKDYIQEHNPHYRRYKRINTLPTGKIDYNYLAIIYLSTLQSLVTNGEDVCYLYQIEKLRDGTKMRNIERQVKISKLKLYKREDVEKAKDFLNNILNKFLIKELSNIIIGYIEIKENVIYI